tara:strand:+ start:448 stop:1113 length:666 start_codon:yes stop_codon:yes gene_type:complete
MWIKESSEKGKRLKDMYSVSGIDVFIKDKLPEDIDAEFVFNYVSSRLPAHLIDGVDIIYIGQFPRMKQKGINAYYEDGAVYVTNQQSDDMDMIDDIIHEIAHACEEMYMDQIYGDGAIVREFTAKRNNLAVILQTLYEVPENFTYKVEYDKEIDNFLQNEVGYTVLNQLVTGIFPSAYAATSVNEYFARGFEEFFIGDRKNLKNTCQVLYRVLYSLISTED